MTEQLLPDPVQAEPKRVKRERSRGQSMVEFALILPIMLVFLLTAADFGRAFTAYMTVSSAAAEGASFASRSAENAGVDETIEGAALNEIGADRQIWGRTPDVSVSRGNDTQGNPWVAVTVEYTFVPLFSVWPIPDEIDMDRTVRMRILGS